MQLAAVSSTATPPLLDVATDIRAELAEARFGAATQARAWSARNPGASLDGLLADLYAGIPSAPSGDALAVELDRTLRANRRASAATLAAGEWYGRFGQAGTKRPSLWRDLLEQWQQREIARLGPVDGAARAVQGAKLVLDAITTANIVIWKTKPVAREPRPYVLDPRSKVPPGGWTPADYESHPSGHAGTAAAAATVLGALWPERRAEFDQLADRVSYSRVLGTMHFPHDVVSGTRIGVAAATAHILRDPVLGTQLAAAHVAA